VRAAVEEVFPLGCHVCVRVGEQGHGHEHSHSYTHQHKYIGQRRIDKIHITSSKLQKHSIV
jgi:hypothetical protein